MILAAQYYRPPFPEDRFWADDFSAMRGAGLNAVQLWVLWSWVEAVPGRYDFTDYDRLVDLAGTNGLRVVLSTIAELHPSWIHRLIPGSEMVDHLGNKVVSTNRVEAHQGLTPGGCTDNPAVLDRQRAFLDAVAARYAGCPHLAGWDCWNELRWNVQSDGLACFCPHTLAAFRHWLAGRYGDLAGLNRAWNRRYASWDDVQPGKLPPRPYTEMMEFEAFLQWRAADHARFRYEVIRARDGAHVITAHGPQPSFAMAGDALNHAMNRGHDFDVAAPLDGFGVSHFPFWFRIRDEDFGVRVESTRSAAAGKLVWVSELQGGSARQGFAVYPSVRAKPQQRWVWNGFGRGAKAVIFWCWRDEVFGKESSGYGLAGLDGYADERLAAMRATAAVLDLHEAVLEAYQPDPARAGVWIDTNTYNLEWAQDGCAARARASVTGWMSCFERIGVPYDLVDSAHLDGLDRLRLLVMPFPLIVPEPAAARISAWVRGGGLLVTEADLDCFSTLGLYRYPGADRPFAHGLGIKDAGRRVLVARDFGIVLDGHRFDLRFEIAKLTQELQSLAARETGEFFTPLEVPEDAVCLARDRTGNVLAFTRTVDSGSVVAFGGYLGRAYDREPYGGLETFLRSIAARAGVVPALVVRAAGRLQWRTGRSGPERLLFVINPGASTLVTVRGDASSFGASREVRHLRDDQVVELRGPANRRTFRFSIEEGGWAGFRWSAGG